jgi:hypothetical protein
MVILIGVVMTRRSPGHRQIIGLVGFVGVATMASPMSPELMLNLSGSRCWP